MMQMTCTQLSDKDCFYISESRNKLLSYPIHCHADYELNFMEHGRGVRRVVGDSDEIIGESDLVLITGKDLEHVWDRTGCESSDVHEITIHFSADLFGGSFMHKTHFQSIFTMLEKAQRGLAFSEECVQKVYPMFNALVGEKRGFYAVLRFMAILHELSLDEQARSCLAILLPVCAMSSIRCVSIKYKIMWKNTIWRKFVCLPWQIWWG